VRLALDEEVNPYTDYKKGLMFVRYSYDIICDLKTFEKISINGEI
jgi:carbamoyl-phosphate synthase large subunit